MVHVLPKTTSSFAIAAVLTGALAFALPTLHPGSPVFGSSEVGPSQEERTAPVSQECRVDLRLPGMMSDILSNALMGSFGKSEPLVRGFLDQERGNHPDGAALLKATAAHFKIEEARLLEEVERYRHCNCTHDGGGAIASSDSAGEELPLEITPFAEDVLMHVVLHEMGHALVREFDLPVLGNEETLADAFATCYLTAHLPERAGDVLLARVQSLMIEAAEVPRSDWSVSGEHNSDARRAFQIAALAVAANPTKYRRIGLAAGMTDEHLRSAADYGTEIHRSWRRILRPLRMPEGQLSRETRLQFDAGSGFGAQLRGTPLLGELRSALRSFDWHSQVTIRFVDGAGGAAWSRSKRTITVNSAYVQRFVRQGALLK